MLLRTTQCIHFWIGLLSLLAASGCKTISATNTDSTVKTGDLDLDRSLMSIPAGVSIVICNALTVDPATGRADANAQKILELTANAVKDWAKTVDRNDSVQIIEGCGTAPAGAALITVQFPQAVSGVADMCFTTNASGQMVRSFALAWATNLDLYHHLVTICDQSNAPSVDVMYHEVGHLWGNCDQYQLAAGQSFATQRLQHPSCGRSFGSQKGECSAMNAVGPDHPKTVTRADCEIMQQMGAVYSSSRSTSGAKFTADCTTYPGVEKCGLSAGTSFSGGQGQDPRCPAGFYYGTDNYCHQGAASAQGATQGCPSGQYLGTDGRCYSQNTCPAGTVLYNDGMCR